MPSPALEAPLHALEVSFAFCRGRNVHGELGAGVPLDDTKRPKLVAGGHAWRAVAAGFSHSCGVTRTGALYCWGSGLGFRLEPGSYHEQPSPFAVAGWR